MNGIDLGRNRSKICVPAYKVVEDRNIPKPTDMKNFSEINLITEL